MNTETKLAAPAKKSVPTIKDHLSGENFKSQLRAALPKHCSPDRFVRIALTAVTRTPKLLQADQASFFQALLSLSQFGLEPDGRRAHLIPFENRKRGCTEVQLIIDYKGLVELIMRSGEVSNIHADVVCEHDEFEFNMGQVQRHSYKLGQPRGNPIGAFSICTFKDGSTKAEVMGKDDIEVIRARSRSANNGPWVTDWAEMAKKTVFRRLSKWLPLSPEIMDAVEHDDIADKEMKQAKVVPAPQLYEAPEPEAEQPEQITAEAPQSDFEPVGVKERSPTPKTSPEAKPATTAAGPKGDVEVILSVCKSQGVSEGKLIGYMLGKGVIKDDSISSLTELAFLYPAIVADLVEEIGTIAPMIAKRN